MYKNKKPIIMAVLCALIVVMAIGFALLSQELNITGTSHIDSNWNIRITNISADPSGSAEDKVASGDCTTRTSGVCNSTSATFNAGLTTPGDSITYTVTVTNSGTLDGVVSSINLTCSENEAIQCTTTGLSRGDTIAKNGGTNTVNVIVTYNSATTSQPANVNSEITLTINYQQDLGQVTPPAPSYDHVVGETITYKDTTWKVIKNSPSNENYVTLMKTTVLTNAELGTYAYGSGYDTMEYTWTSTCHNANHHGYSEGQYDCDNTNSYTSSKIKEAIEAYATSKGMMNDLTEVAVGGTNYKIRLITKDELETNLGFEEQVIGTGTGIENTELTPTWVYTNFGENQNNVYGYWTMTPHPDYASDVWSVGSGGGLSDRNVDNISRGVRPVINLLKSNIPAQS